MNKQRYNSEILKPHNILEASSNTICPAYITGLFVNSEDGLI